MRGGEPALLAQNSATKKRGRGGKKEIEKLGKGNDELVKQLFGTETQ